MILCEFTPSGGTLQRISIDDLALTYLWYNHIQSIASIKFALSKSYGGFAKPTFSSFGLSPDMFEDSWLPPKTATVKLIQTESTYAAGIILFTGTAQLSGYDRTTINYRLKPDEFSKTITAGTVLSGTLLSNVTTFCGPTYLDLTLDSTEGRAVSPAVSYTVPQDIQCIDLLDDLCAFFSHSFNIVEDTLYLYDMLGTTTPINLDEFDVFPCSYSVPNPISLVTGGTESVAGSSPNGDEVSISTVYHSTAANIITALTDIKDILERDIATVNTYIADDKPTVLGNFTLYDESTINDLTVSARAVSVIYNFDNSTMRIEGHGEIVAGIVVLPP